MAKAGKAPLPTALKILKGVDKSRINFNEPKAAAILPEPPSHLDAVAKAKWRQLAPVLYNMGVLTEADIEAFTMMCSCHAKMMKCEKELKKDGLVYFSKVLNTTTKTNPHWQIYLQLSKHLEVLYAHFGMTPSSRSRITLDKKSGPVDDFAEFMESTGS
jgi:P27 family predicted phage terminase small subunit